MPKNIVGWYVQLTRKDSRRGPTGPTRWLVYISREEALRFSRTNEPSAQPIKDAAKDYLVTALSNGGTKRVTGWSVNRIEPVETPATSEAA